ncbi:MAG TPA: (deoxy)nucleoside triphosphate pyrophosphohydrolase [Bacteroidales bacterium]|nr:(deoxy)nucleoside triphosphate pyrophosphohydrolase [Bacteroidales bacterium]
MIDVTCAIIQDEDEKILVVQRGEKTDHPFRWEFPGGKTSPGECHEDCIVREIYEELGIDIVIRRRLDDVEYDYGFKKIRLIPFICDTLEEVPVLTEHISFRWVPADELENIDFCEADSLVAEKYLMENRFIAGNTGSDPEDEAISEKDENDLREMINNMMSTHEADWLSDTAVANPAVYRKLLEYSLSDNDKLAFRASWTLSKVYDKNPGTVIPHLRMIADSLGSIRNESVERSFLRILSLSDMGSLTGKQHGFLADYCFAELGSATSAVAVKAYSMEILYRLTLKYPQLANELAVSIRNVMEEGSAGIVARGNSILKKITAIPLDPGSSQ